MSRSKSPVKSVTMTLRCNAFRMTATSPVWRQYSRYHEYPQHLGVSFQHRDGISQRLRRLSGLSIVFVLTVFNHFYWLAQRASVFSSCRISALKSRSSPGHCPASGKGSLSGRRWDNHWRRCRPDAGATGAQHQAASAVPAAKIFVFIQ